MPLEVLTPDTPTPVVVDADNGYGNEDNVVRTVREMEFAGAAAIVMEDQVLPKRCGHTANKRIVPLPHYLNKLECALKCRETPMVVVARTDAPTLDEAIMRAKAFQSAGADMILIDGVRSLDMLRRIGEEVPGPKQVNLIYGGLTPLLSAPELQQMGFKVILYSTPTLFLVAQAMWEWLPKLKQTHDLKSLNDGSCQFGDFQRFLQEVYTAKVGIQAPSVTEVPAESTNVEPIKSVG